MYVNAERLQKDILELPKNSVVREIKDCFKHIPHLEDTSCEKYSLEYDSKIEYFSLVVKMPPMIENGYIYIIYPIIDLIYGNLDRKIHLTIKDIKDLDDMWEYIKMFRNQKNTKTRS